MPELPEVETVRRGLAQTIDGATIAEVTLRRGDLRIPFAPGFVEGLTGRRIRAIERRAKYLQLHLDQPNTLVIHLGMSGRLTLSPSLPNQFLAHDHVVFRLKDGRALIFNDARRFGLMALVPTSGLEAHEFFSHLGPEPLEEAFSIAYLYAALQKRSIAVKLAIMDQELVVGVGNIYASEALFLSKIDPRRAARSITRKESGALQKAIRQVLLAAIESGGSTLRDFVRSSGDAGYFQHHFQVYDRESEACFRCKNPIQQIRQGGRSTYFCANCQR